MNTSFLLNQAWSVENICVLHSEQVDENIAQGMK